MSNHPGRKAPAWLARAEEAAAERIASAGMPVDGALLALTRAQVEALIRDAVVWGYSRGRADERGRT